MKEIISSVLLVVTLFAGTRLLREMHDTLKRAALDKAAGRLPSLVQMNQMIRQRSLRQDF